VLKLNEAELKLKQTTTEHEMNVERAKVEFETLKSQKNSEIEKLTDAKVKIIESSDREINELKLKIDQLKLEKINMTEENETKLKLLNEENRKYLVELNSLRTYVNDSLPTIQTVKEMGLERQKCDEQIQKVKSKNEQLIKENNALQIRLKSINEILSIQESQLESKLPLPGNSPFGIEKRYQGI
jgi:chromosome segregation ATPase